MPVLYTNTPYPRNLSRTNLTFRKRSLFSVSCFQGNGAARGPRARFLLAITTSFISSVLYVPSAFSLRERQRRDPLSSNRTQRNAPGMEPMKQLFDLPGIVTVLNTPFLADDSLDLDGLRTNVRYAIDVGVAGFLVPAMASEVGKLSARERTELVETVVTAAAGRVPVIGGASAPLQSERLAAARDLIRLGCAGILASIPFDGEGPYRRDVHELASLGPGFLMLQDWDVTGEGLPLPLIVRLFDEVDAFRCLKIETANASAKYTRVLEETAGRLHVSGGWAVTQMIDGLDRGVHAFMPTGSIAPTRASSRFTRAAIANRPSPSFTAFVPYSLSPISTSTSPSISSNACSTRRESTQHPGYADPSCRSTASTSAARKNSSASLSGSRTNSKPGDKSGPLFPIAPIGNFFIAVFALGKDCRTSRQTLWKNLPISLRQTVHIC